MSKGLGFSILFIGIAIALSSAIYPFILFNISSLFIGIAVGVLGLLIIIFSRSKLTQFSN